MPDALDVRLGLATEEDLRAQAAERGANAGDENKNANQPNSGNTGNTTTATAESGQGGNTDITVTPQATAAAASLEESEEEADAKALARYNKRKGTSFKTWDEVDAAQASPASEPTEQEKKKAREKQKIKFALDHDLISPEQYENYIADSRKEARDFVFENFYRERKAAGDSDAVIDAKFARLYGEDEAADDDDAVTPFVNGKKKEALEREAARLIKKTYPEFFTLDQKFDAHLTQQQREQQQRAQLTQLATTYKGDVEAIATSTTSKQVTFTHDGEEFTTTVPYLPAIIDTVKKEFLQPASLGVFTANYSKEAVQQAFLLRLDALSQGGITAHVAKAYHAEQEKKKKVVRNHLVPEEILGSSSDKAQDELDRRASFLFQKQ